MKIQQRGKVLVNTDPQRRCYNGCHFSSEIQWTEWETIEWGLSTEKVEDRLDFWRRLNDYAVSQRGESAYTEFRVIGDEE